jgi:hypothetical protein
VVESAFERAAFDPLEALEALPLSFDPAVAPPLARSRPLEPELAVLGDGVTRPPDPRP